MGEHYYINWFYLRFFNQRLVIAGEREDKVASASLSEPSVAGTIDDSGGTFGVSRC